MSDLYHIPTNNTTIRRDSDGSVVVTLHNTPILTIEPDGRMILDHGGYRTHTTKTRLNQLARVWDLGYSVHQDAGRWYVNDMPWCGRTVTLYAPVPAAEIDIARRQA